MASPNTVLTLGSGFMTALADAGVLISGAGVTSAAGPFSLDGANSIVNLVAGSDFIALAGDGKLDFSLATGIVSFGTGQATFAGNVDATAGLDVTVSPLTVASSYSQTAGAFAHVGSTNTVTLTGVATLNVADNTADAYKVREGTNNYIAVTTTNGSEQIAIGNATTNPVVSFLTTALTTLAGSLAVLGSLTVSGTLTALNSVNLNIQDANVYIGNGYTTAVARSGGWVFGYLPIATSTTTAGFGVFTAGVAAVSNPTFTAAGAAVFSAGQFIQISGSVDNDGIYEVLSDTGSAPHTVTVKGVGTTPTVEAFTQNQLVGHAGDTGATGTRMTISVVRVGTDGIPETGASSVTPITFTDFSTSVAPGWTDGGTLVSLTTSTDRVAIGADQAATLNITSSSNIDTVNVRGSAAQTANLLNVENSGGTDLFTVTPSQMSGAFGGSANFTFNSGGNIFNKVINATGIDLTAGSYNQTAGNWSFSGGGVVSGTLPDNTANVFSLVEGANNYLRLVTTNGSEEIRFGNATTNPVTNFLGTGTVTLSGLGQFNAGIQLASAQVITGAVKLAFSDSFRGGSTYGINLFLANASINWSDAETAFGGEFSILEMLTSAKNSGQTTVTAGATIAAGDLIASNSSGAAPSDHSASGVLANAYGFAPVGIASAGSGLVQLVGTITLAAARFTGTAPAGTDDGKTVYASAATAGKVTLTAPSTAGQVRQKVGVLVSTDGANANVLAIQIGDLIVL